MHSPAPSLADEPRGSPRHKVFLPADMAGAEGRARVHLLNLSAAGALIHANAAPKAGTIVHFSCAEVSWTARVIWTQQKRFGVVHVPPLGTGALDALVGRPTAA